MNVKWTGRGYTAKELAEMPTLSPWSQHDHLKIDEGDFRVWLFRDGTVQEEKLVELQLRMGVRDKCWHPVAKYQG